MAGQVYRAQNPQKKINVKDGKTKAQKSQEASKLIISVLPIGTKLPASGEATSSSSTGIGLSSSSEIINPSDHSLTPTSTSTSSSSSTILRAPPRHPDVTSGVLARVTRITPRHAQVDILCLSPAISSSPPATPFAPNQANNKQKLHPASREYTPLAPPYPTGLIRAQDIRATPLDTISTPGGSIGNATSSLGGSSGANANSSLRGVILSAFRVGDVVRAVVISMGDQQHYYLSTAADELGVVLAVSAGEGVGGGEKVKGGMGGGRMREGNLMYPLSWREMRDPVTGVTEARKVARPF